MKHIVISGVTSCESRGVEALVRSVVTHASTDDRHSVVVLSQTPCLDAAALADLGPALRCVADPFVVSRSWASLRPTETQTQLAARREEIIGSASLVIGTGGDLHTPDYGVSTPYLRVLSAAQEQGVPTAMVGQSWGPFTNTAEADALVAVADCCELLSVREQASHQYATDRLGLAQERIRLSADPAFLLPHPDDDRLAQILASCGLAPKDPYLCVAVSQGITRYSTLTDQQHLHALLDLLQQLTELRRLPVLLVPHCHDSRPHNDDRILAAELSALAASHLAQAVPGPLSAVDYKGILAGASFVISERLHAAIGALSSGTPAVVVGHSHKFSGVLAHAYGSQMPTERFHLDIHSATDPGAWTPLLRPDNESVLRHALGERLPVLLHAARSDFTTLHRITSPCP